MNNEKLTANRRARLWILAGLAGLSVALVLVSEARAHQDESQSTHPEYFHYDWETVVCPVIEDYQECPTDNHYIIHKWPQCVGIHNDGWPKMRDLEEREIRWMYRKYSDAMQDDLKEGRIWVQYLYYKCVSRNAWWLFYNGTWEYKNRRKR